MLTWTPSCASLVAIEPFISSRSDLRKKFTDGQTDDGRRAIVLAHGMSTNRFQTPNVNKTANDSTNRKTDPTKQNRTICAVRFEQRYFFAAATIT